MKANIHVDKLLDPDPTLEKFFWIWFGSGIEIKVSDRVRIQKIWDSCTSGMRLN